MNQKEYQVLMELNKIDEGNVNFPKLYAGG